MSGQNNPQDDAKAMYAEYIKGATIDDLAAKYGHTNGEVLAICVKDADSEPDFTQAQQNDKEVAPKKDK